MKKLLVSLLSFLSLTICKAQELTCSLSTPGPYNYCVGNQSINFFADCTGPGTDNFVYTWQVQPPGGSYGLVGDIDGYNSQLSYSFTQVGTYLIHCLIEINGENGNPDIYQKELMETVTVGSTPSIPSVIIDKTTICSGDDVSLSISNPVSGVSYSWSSDPGGFSGTGTSITFSNVTQSTTFYAIASLGTCSASNARSVVVNGSGTLGLDPSMSYHKRILIGNSISYLQSSSYPDGTSTETPRSARYTITQPGSFYLRYYNDSQECWGMASPLLNVTEFNYVPPLPIVSQTLSIGYNSIFLSNADKQFILQFADYYWVDGLNTTNVVDEFSDNYHILRPGDYYLRGKDRGTGTWGPTLTIRVELLGDNGLNSVHTKAFDGISDLTPYAESKSYFDYSGSEIQTQAKIHTATDVFIFTSAKLYDRYERVVGASLPAPILQKEFKCNLAFLLNADGQLYDYTNFDIGSKVLDPNPVGHIDGTVGDYYKEGDGNVPFTNFPYFRTEFYDDGTGEVKLSAGPGETHRMGQGREVLSGTFPVYNELDDYITKRRTFLQIPDNLASASLTKRGVQSVVRDQNGNYAISINDQAGNTVFSARKGTSQENVLTVPVSITSTLDVNDANYRPITYFYILDDQTVNISAGDYVIEDIITGTTYAPTGGSWAKGFYRILLNSGTVTLSYSNYFLDVAYQFYDDAGRLKSSLSPKGFQQLKSANPPSYSTADQTSYIYNYQGWLLSMREADAGITNYQYRKDGNIRFSQNAEQATPAKNDFSYTHYDQLGRPIESGEYFGTQYTFGSLQAELEYSQQVFFPSADTRDWVKTYYDLRVGSIPNLPAQFKQEFVRGAVSSTENSNIQTWYSYDEMGRVTWMAQRPGVLNRTFVTQYTYDFLGNVLTVKNSSYINESESGVFYHHYTYDADQRLQQAFTSTDGTNKNLRATYEYYLHGPLKRIELGEELQGVDFVYNINGWLTHINHPDKTMDPGGDSNDAFGMLLNYYESQLNGVYSSSIPSHNPNERHHSSLSGQNQLIHQPLIRFESAIESPVQNTGENMRSIENNVHRKMLSQFNAPSSN
jgi:hypothetical protein